jgi:hypothetical protein
MIKAGGEFSLCHTSYVDAGVAEFVPPMQHGLAVDRVESTMVHGAPPH